MDNRAMMAPVETVKLSDGTTRRMEFDMGAFAHAENAYELHFGKCVNVNVIIGELARQQMRSVMAMAYGAMISAGEKLTWEQFAKGVFTYADSLTLTDAVANAVLKMYRGNDGGGEGDEKNVNSRGAVSSGST